MIRAGRIFAVSLAIGLWLSPAGAEPVGTAFTYQGQLKQGGVPVNGTCDFEFRLWNDPTSTDPARQVGDTLIFDSVAGNPPPVAVLNGLFTVELDFGASAFDDQTRWLDITVACPAGAGVFTTLAPRQKLTPVPYAVQTRGLHVDDAGNVGIGTTNPGAKLDVAGGRIRLFASDSASLTAYATAADSRAYLSLVAQTSTPTQREWRITNDGPLGGALVFMDTSAGARQMVIDSNGRVGIGTSSPNSALEVAGTVHSTSGGFKFPDGSVQATAGGAALWSPSGRDIFYNAGNVGIGTTPTVPLHVVGRIKADGGSLLSTNPNNPSASVELGWHRDLALNDVAHIRVDGEGEGAANGLDIQGPRGISYMRILSSRDPRLKVHGTVHSTSGGFKFPDGTTQETAAVAGLPAWSLNGNAGTTPGTNFLGTTDTQALELHVDNQRALRLEPNATSPNLIGGSSANSVTAGVLGATISGGGAADDGFGIPSPNRVTDDYGTVAGGIKNQAGDDDANTGNATSATVGGGWRNTADGFAATLGGGTWNNASDWYATVGGGSNNKATGRYATVGGGGFNWASGYSATVAGGDGNIAAGDFSFAAGREARADHAGTFVWADSTGAITSTADNQFLIQASGGVGIGTNEPAHALHVVSDGERAVFGENTAASGGTYGGYFQSDSTGGTGVFGWATAGTGPTRGGYFQSDSTTGRGVVGWASAGTGGAVGGYFQTDSTDGRGVEGLAFASTGDTYGGWFRSLSTSGTGYGVYGVTSSPSGYGVFSQGDYGGTGAKYFVQPHPTDPSKEIRFISLEGNESGTYFRGSARLADGWTVIEVPQEFRLVSEAEGLTVQLTPMAPDAGLWVELKSLDEIVVRGNGNVEFDYFVNGVRRGYADLELIRENHAYVPELRGVPYGTQYAEGHRRILVENGILNPDFTPNEQTAARMGWTLKDLEAEGFEENRDPEPVERVGHPPEREAGERFLEMDDDRPAPPGAYPIDAAATQREQEGPWARMEARIAMLQRQLQEMEDARTRIATLEALAAELSDRDKGGAR